MPYLIIFSCALAALACVWLPELRRRSEGRHACDDGSPDDWQPYARSFGRHVPRHASPRISLLIGNYLRRAIASHALVLLVAWQRYGAITPQAA